MYDAYDRTPGEDNIKFTKMFTALKTRSKAIKDPVKWYSLIEMLRQESENSRWTSGQRKSLHSMCQDLMRKVV